MMWRSSCSSVVLPRYTLHPVSQLPFIVGERLVSL